MVRLRSTAIRGGLVRRLGAAVVVVCLLASCGGRLERTARNPAAAVDPDGVEWILVTPPLEEVRIGALRILVNVEGLLGVVDLLRASYEIDLGDEDLLVNLGLDPDLPLVGLGLSEGICLLLPARRGAPVEDILRRVGETSGYRVETEAADKGLLTRVYDDEQRCLVALLSVEGLLLLGYAPDGRADAAVARVALNHLPEDAPGIEVLEGRFLLEWWNSGSGPTRPDVAGWSGPLAGLGHWLHSVKAGVARARLTFKVGLEGINWDLDVVPFETAGEGGTPESADHHYDWKDAVPEDTVLTVQIRDQAEETLGHLLGGKGLYILGLLAGEILGEKKVPALRQALEAMEPQIALVLLGADPRAHLGKERLIHSILHVPDDAVAALHVVGARLDHEVQLAGQGPPAVVTNLVGVSQVIAIAFDLRGFAEGFFGESRFVELIEPEERRLDDVAVVEQIGRGAQAEHLRERDAVGKSLRLPYVVADVEALLHVEQA